MSDRFRIILPMLLFSILFASIGRAEDGDGSLVVHGFLTQAYAVSDGNTIFGIPDQGTTDYRTAALQVRYGLTKRDNIVIQFSHERLGESALNDLQDDVKLDWAFVQHSFNDSTWVKAGRVQIPIGIYNELRDVGTVLPFYRPSLDVYGLHSFTSETIDGIVGFHRFFQNSPWHIETNLYYGGWEFFKDNQYTFTKDRIEKAFGAQVWIVTPLNGVRFGVHPARETVRDGFWIPDPGKVENLNTWYLSADATFESMFIRTEYRYQGFPGGHFSGFYAQAGRSLIPKLWLAAQYETAGIQISIPFVFSADQKTDEDWGISVRYFYKPNIVLRAETHWNSGIHPSEPVSRLGIDPPLKTFYFIGGISASF